MEIAKFTKVNVYLFVCCLFIFFEILLISKGNWSGDFWEHSAVVNELSKDLIHPGNPIIKTDTPHAFFSPYSLLVAIFSKVTKINSIHSLECFAIINLIFFLWSLYFFCKSIFEKNYILIALLSLFFILLFWGKEPPMWSAFFHILVLHSILPYPSTFSLSLVFIILATISKNMKYSFMHIFIVTVLSSVVLITHPTTAIFLFTAIFAYYLKIRQLTLKECIKKSIIIIIPSIVLCLLWPYYNFLDLFIERNIDFHQQSKVLYSGVLKTNWPFLLVLPGFFIFKHDRTLSFLIISGFFLLLIFTIGYVVEFYGLARVVSNIMMLSQIILAYVIVISVGEKKYLKIIYSLSIIVAFILSISINYQSIYYTSYGIFRNRNIQYYKKYNFLENYVTSNSIIYSDENSNSFIPSFGGKVISSDHPLYWINDIDLRRKDVNSFFNIDNSDSLRQVLINKYNPEYVLIDKSLANFNISTYTWLNIIGNTVFENNQLVLIKIY